MAFIRTKRIKGILYRYRVESTRVGGKVQQRVLEYIGRAQPKPSKASKPKAKKIASAPKKAARLAPGRMKPKARKAETKAARKTVRRALGRAKTKARKAPGSKKKRK